MRTPPTPTVTAGVSTAPLMTVIVGACTSPAPGSVFPGRRARRQRRDGRARHHRPRRAGCGRAADAARFVRERLEDRRRRPHRRRLARCAPPDHRHRPPTGQPSSTAAGPLPVGVRDVGRHRVGRRDLAQNHAVPRRSASVPPGCGARPAGSSLVVIAAVLVELWAIRQLAAEWAYEARSSWWWSPWPPQASATRAARPVRPTGTRPAQSAAAVADRVNDVDLMDRRRPTPSAAATCSSAPASASTPAPTTDERVARVPRYEDDAVTNCGDAGHLVGGTPTTSPDGRRDRIGPPSSSRPPPATASPAGHGSHP